MQTTAPTEERDRFQWALDIDVYFSDDAEVSWAKMKEAVKVSLFKPEVLRDAPAEGDRGIRL